MRLLVVLDPLERLALYGDTTYALMLEAVHRGHEIWTCQPHHLSLEHDDPVAAALPTEVHVADHPADAFTVGERISIPLDAFSCVLMRKDPPVDTAYLQATWLLERARGKTLLVNDPRGLRELNEHLAILHFPELVPPTVVTSDPARLRAFLDEQGGAIIVKPVDGYGGLGVFLVQRDDPNAGSIFEMSTRQGTIWTMAQRYLPEARRGDKRILLLAGRPLGAVLRVPAEHDARSNLHVGGTPVASDLTGEDLAIVRTVAPLLKAHGQIFVGIDVIGGRLTEINVTSPTGIRHMDRLSGGNHAAPVIDWLQDEAAALAAGKA